MKNKTPEFTNFCQRCKTLTTTTVMSMFNTQMCCTKCLTNERLHPDFPKAREAEAYATRNGNPNFQGIGLPEDLQP